jgi:hypothetical protein
MAKARRNQIFVHYYGTPHQFYSFADPRFCKSFCSGPIVQSHDLATILERYRDVYDLCPRHLLDIRIPTVRYAIAWANGVPHINNWIDLATISLRRKREA